MDECSQNQEPGSSPAKGKKQTLSSIMSQIKPPNLLLGLVLASTLLAHQKNVCHGDIVRFHEARKTDIRIQFGCELVGHGRVDSVVSPGTCAGHMHSFFGNTNIDNVIDIDRIENFSATSCNVEQGSLYWVPSLYNIDSSGRYQIINDAFLVVYYEFPFDTEEAVNPIPLGFRQLVGDASRDTPFPNNPPDQTQFWPYYTCYGEDDAEFYALTIEEFASSGQKCSRLEATVIFRDCLNSTTVVDSGDHKSHAAYAQEGQPCPDTHPYRIPRVRLEVNWDFGGNFYDMNDVVLSTGKHSASMHGDYIAGWESQKLLEAIETCTLDSETCSLNSDFDQDFGPVLVDSSLFPDEPVTDLASLILTSTDGCPEGFGSPVPAPGPTPLPVATPTAAPVATPATPAPIPASRYFEFYNEKKDKFRTKNCTWLEERERRARKWCNEYDHLHERDISESCPLQCAGFVVR